MPDPSRRRGPSVFDRLTNPLRNIARAEWSGGFVLVCAVAVALAWANSPWSAQYHELWSQDVSFRLGENEFSATLRTLVADGLLAIFFFVIALEIKRELLVGELATWRRAVLPLAAALGGLLVPAGIYVALNAGADNARGWGVVAVTDIALAHGVFALMAQRAPAGLGVFLSALAIVDDIGAVLIVSLFYLGTVAWWPLAIAAGFLGLAAIANVTGIRTPWVYGSIGVALWIAIMASGINANIAGILLATAIPVRRRIAPKQFLDEARSTLQHFERAYDPSEEELDNEERHKALDGLKTLLSHAQPPLVRIERALRGFVFIGVIPFFALANAGVSLGPGAISAALNSSVALGIVLGLVVGKPVGIALASWLVMRANLGDAPENVSWRQIVGIGCLAGMGFSISLYIARLAFAADAAKLEAAQLAILVASLVVGGTGAALIRGFKHERQEARA